MALHTSTSRDEWYIDSGGSKHMTPHDLLENKKIASDDKVTAANGAKISITGVGDGKFTFGNGNVKIGGIMHVPDLAVNLLSVSQIVKNGNKVVFDSDGCTIFNCENERVLFCKESGGVYKVNADEKKCLLAKNKTLSAYE